MRMKVPSICWKHFTRNILVDLWHDGMPVITMATHLPHEIKAKCQPVHWNPEINWHWRLYSREKPCEKLWTTNENKIAFSYADAAIAWKEKQVLGRATHLYKPVLKGFLLSFCFCFKASVLKSFISCSAVISLCRPRGTRCTSLGLTPSYSSGNVNPARSCVATVARVRCSHKLSCSLVCIRNESIILSLIWLNYKIQGRLFLFHQITKAAIVMSLSYESFWIICKC